MMKKNYVNSNDDGKDDSLIYKVGDFVNILFKRKHYVGQIIKRSTKYNEYFINFMKKRYGKYVFPKVREEMWMRPREVVGIYENK